MKQIKIGTLVNGQEAVRLLPQIIPYGFESFSLTFWQTTGNLNLSETAKQVNEILADKKISISCLSIFGNVLTGKGKHADTLKSWERLIDVAHEFGTNLITGFTGRIPETVEQSLPRFTEVFGELAKRAEDKGVKLAFENCDMGGTWKDGDWNIAFNP